MGRMHALVRAASATGILAALSALLAPVPATPARPPEGLALLGSTASLGSAAHLSGSSAPLASGPLPAQVCPPRFLPVEGAARGPLSCLPLPSPGRPLRGARAERLASEPLRAEPVRWGLQSESIPRLPGRPDRYELYELPVESAGLVSPASPTDLGGDDLARWLRPDRRPSGELAGLRIETSPDAPVSLPDLEGQQGAAEVVLVGQMVGVTVATRHRVEQSAGLRDYLLLFGDLSRPGPEIVSGASIGPGAVVGYAGDRGGTDAPHLYLEVRQLRLGARLGSSRLVDLVRPTTSIPCDPRNVLRLR